MQNVIGIIIIIALIGGGYYFFTQSGDNHIGHSEDEHMMEDGTMMEGEKHDDAMMEKEDGAMMEDKDGAMMEKEDGAAMEDDNVVSFTVEGENFSFAPSQIEVKEGDTVRITFKNVGGFHDFVIDEFDVATSQFGAGNEETVEFVADKTGSFEFYCSVGNHREQGMVGTLTVTE